MEGRVNGEEQQKKVKAKKKTLENIREQYRQGMHLVKSINNISVCVCVYYNHHMQY